MAAKLCSCFSRKVSKKERAENETSSGSVIKKKPRPYDEIDVNDDNMVTVNESPGSLMNEGGSGTDYVKKPRPYDDVELNNKTATDNPSESPPLNYINVDIQSSGKKSKPVEPRHNSPPTVYTTIDIEATQKRKSESMSME